jgi:hypothetical protein
MMSQTPPDSLQELARKVEHLLDRQAILDCVYRYCRGLDRHDEAILESVFHPDAIDHHGRFVGRVPEFIKFANDGHAQSTLGHTHNITCHFAEIDGNTAHAESYIIFCLRQKDEKVVHVGGGRYIDRLEKRNGEWRIVRRRLVMDWRFEADGTAWAKRPTQTPGTWDKNDLSYMRPFEFPPEVLAQVRDAK